MAYLEKNKTKNQSIYWRNLDKKSKNKHGMIFYTSDSYMIFGISRVHSERLNTKNEEECLNEMKMFFNTEEGYITYECPPEISYSDFMLLVNRYKNKKT